MTAADVYEQEQVEQRLRSGLPAWQLRDGQLCRSFATADFRTALLLANAIGHLAELGWHHPELTVAWGQVGVRLMSHDVGGITDRDFELAAEIERLATWRPGEGDALSGTPDEERWRYLVRD